MKTAKCSRKLFLQAFLNVITLLLVFEKPSFFLILQVPEFVNFPFPFIPACEPDDYFLSSSFSCNIFPTESNSSQHMLLASFQPLPLELRFPLV